MTALELIDIYISFFEKKGHKRIPNAPLVPENDPTTLFTSSGMQPLVSYLLGEPHPLGKRLVNVQNCFRAQDIDEVGDNRHTTFFRMLGNWSLGDYFKAEQLPWFFEFLTKELKLPREKLYITIFKGDGGVGFDSESGEIWKEVLTKSFGSAQDHRIFKGDVSMNWWSRSGVPKNMPVGEPGGPDSEVYYKFNGIEHGTECQGDDPTKCECGRFLEIANAVFMQYVKSDDGTFKQLTQKNVDFGGGLERLLAAVEEKSDIFQTSLFSLIIKAIEKDSGKNYKENAQEMRIIADHLIASVFISNSKVRPSNKEQGYILRRLLRRAFDNFYKLGGKNITPVIHKIAEQYSETDPALQENFEEIKLTILEEEQNYKGTLLNAIRFIEKKYGGRMEITGDWISGWLKEEGGETKGMKEISPDDAFVMYTTHGLSPTQIKSLGFTFNEKGFAEKMKEHQKVSRKGAEKKFAGGLADQNEQTVKGHTATHLLHQALRDVLGNSVHQTGSNITVERIRFDFNYDKKLADEEIKKVEDIVNEKITQNLAVSFKITSVDKAKEQGAIGLFGEKYGNKVKVYFIGDYSKEICGGPHVEFTGSLKRFKIIKQETIGRGQRRIYAVLEN